MIDPLNRSVRWSVKARVRSPDGDLLDHVREVETEHDSEKAARFEFRKEMRETDRHVVSIVDVSKILLVAG